MVVVGRAGFEVEVQDHATMAKLGVVFVPTATTEDVRSSGIIQQLVRGGEVHVHVCLTIDVCCLKLPWVWVR